MRSTVLGCPVDVLTMDEVVDLARSAMHSRERVQHVALNVAKLVNMRRDAVLAADVIGSDLITMDGIGVVWAARLFGLPAKERVTGIDLLARLLAVCAREGLKPYFLGAKSSVLQRAVQRVTESHPSICFAGMRDGYFSPEQEDDVVDEIRKSGADCLFIGMPTPRKERFLSANRERLNTPFIMGVGGSFDVLAGHVQRAPERWQALGFEWLYRIYQEPRRMWWRYAKTNTLFLGIIAQAAIDAGLHAVPGLRAAGRSNLAGPGR